MPERIASRLSRRDFLEKTLLRTAAVAGTAWAGSRLEWWRPLIGHSASGGVAGTVKHVLTAKPVAGATITVSGTTTAAATSDDKGRYQVTLPAGQYEVQVSAAGYLSMTRTAQVTSHGNETRVDFEMLPANPTPQEQEAIYDKVVKVPEGPSLRRGQIPGGSDDIAAMGTVVVPETIVVLMPDGTLVTMPLDEYLRCVVPAEMPASWHQQALRAQAVAARTYAVAYYLRNGYICTTTSCQVYGNATYPSTDEAVWATSGQVATYNGAIITAFYFARCNGQTTRNSEQVLLNTGYGSTCTVGNWGYLAYCRARPCSGHSAYPYNSCGYYGHGVGMCQHGAWGFATQGLSHGQILSGFYTGIQLTGGTRTPPQPVAPLDGWLQLASSPLTLRWSGTSEQYEALIQSASGGQWRSGWITGTSYAVSLPTGGYTWYVSGRTGGIGDGQSATWRFTLADKLYQQTISGVSKG